MINLLLVMFGGAIGSGLRYLLSVMSQKIFPTQFPLGILIINIVGCFCIGLLAALFLNGVLVKQEYRLILMVGVLGGFTTFSSFAWDTLSLFNSGNISLALLNVVLSNVLAFFAVWFGFKLFS